MLRAGLVLFVASSAFAAGGTKINGVTYNNSGNSVAPQNTKDMLAPAQSLRLKKVFLFPSIDDISGALAPKLDDKVATLFSRNTRFELIRDPQVVKALSPDESSYFKAATNQDVHKEAAKVTGADTTVLLRTRNVGSNTQMVLELRDANGNMLFAEEGSVPGAATMDVRLGQIEKLYTAFLARLPFEGALTGRTANTVTVDLGMGAIKQGEEIEIARVVSVQRHPLLGTVTGTDYVRTGRAKITTVDRVLSFAEITEEFTGEKVSPGQKVLRSHASLVHRGGPEEPEDSANHTPVKRPKGSAKEEENPLDDRLKGEFDRPKARYGVLGVNLLYGSISHAQTVNGIDMNFGGSGVGGDLNGEAWITKNWILSAFYGFHSASPTGTLGELGSSTWNQIRVAGGFRIYPDAMAEGIIITGSLGYQSMNFDFPSNTTLGTGAKKFTGILLAADGDVSFLDKQKISLGFGIQPFATISEGGPTLGQPNHGTVIGLHLGWNRQLTDELWLKLGMRYDVANGSYDGSTTTISEKRFAIGPGLYYSF